MKAQKATSPSDANPALNKMHLKAKICPGPLDQTMPKSPSRKTADLESATTAASPNGRLGVFPTQKAKAKAGSIGERSDASQNAFMSGWVDHLLQQARALRFGLNQYETRARLLSFRR
jgi:hypothetical protein